MKVVFKAGRIQLKKVTCLVSIQTGLSVAKQGTPNVHFANVTEANLQILFKIHEFKGVNDIPKEPFNFIQLWPQSLIYCTLPSRVAMACDEIEFEGELLVDS